MLPWQFFGAKAKMSLPEAFREHSRFKDGKLLGEIEAIKPLENGSVKNRLFIVLKVLCLFLTLLTTNKSCSQKRRRENFCFPSDMQLSFPN